MSYGLLGIPWGSVKHFKPSVGSRDFKHTFCMKEVLSDGVSGQTPLKSEVVLPG